MNEAIDKMYFNPKFPASYTSLNKLYVEAKKKIPKLKREDLEKWSTQSATYTIHKSARKRFPRERIYTRYIDYLWEIDLVNVARLKEFNDNYTYLLVCVDTFSKYAWIRPLLRKTSNETTSAIKSILRERKPTNMRYDQGMEFKNRVCQKLLKTEDIH